jgi:tetratricopeptide (TPR) repeat protein
MIRKAAVLAMMKAGGWVSLAALLLFTWPAPALSEYNSHRWQDGYCSYGNDDTLPDEALDGVIRACKAEIARGGDSPEFQPVFVLYSYLAYAHLRKADFDAVISASDQCIDLWKTLPDRRLADHNAKDANRCYFWKADSYLTLQRYDEAIDAYNAGFAAFPNERIARTDLDTAYSGRARIRAASKDYQGAVNDYKAVFARHQSWQRNVVPDARMAQARQHEAAGQLEEAANAYKELFDQFGLKPSPPEAVRPVFHFGAAPPPSQEPRVTFCLFRGGSAADCTRKAEQAR